MDQSSITIQVHRLAEYCDRLYKEEPLQKILTQIINTGAEVYAYGENGSFPTVYQMELYAIILCLERMKTKKIENKKICIMSHSQAAFKSLIKTEVTSKLTWDCINSLNIPISN